MNKKSSDMVLKTQNKILILALVLFSFVGSNAQIDSRVNLPTYDDKPVHFGYLLGLNYSTFKVVQSENFINSEELEHVYAVGKSGFEVGFIFNLRLSEYFDARALPKVSFYERSINYKFTGVAEPVPANFQSSIMEMPLLIKYKSHRRKNNRLYMVSGLKPGLEVGAKKRQQRNDQIATKSFNLSLEYGLGVDIYYPLFKFSPELRFSLGILDILKKGDNIYSESISVIKPYNISFAIMFE